MSIKERIVKETPKIDIKNAFFQALRNNYMFLFIVFAFIGFWVFVCIFYLIDIFTFIMIILSMLLVIVLFIFWMLERAKLNIALEYNEQLLKTQEKK